MYTINVELPEEPENKRKKIDRVHHNAKDARKEIKELLESVGALSRMGKSPRAHKRRRKSKRLLKSSGGYSEYSPAQFKKSNPKYYRETHDKIQESVRAKSIALDPDKSLQIMKSMRELEEYRRKCGSRILCLDGGGIRGLIQMAVLGEIERRTGKRIVDLFDWIVGTSTGGIITLALTYGI